jgi:hypothetical protein
VVQYRRSPFGHFRTRGTVTLDADRRWRVETEGGLANCVFDLRDTAVDGITIAGGMSSVELALPRPTGAVSVEIRGGVHAVTITRPEGTAAAVDIKGGASNLVIDSQRMGSMGGRTSLRSEGYAGNDSRVEVTVRGGASSLSVVTEAPRRA